MALGPVSLSWTGFRSLPLANKEDLSLSSARPPFQAASREYRKSQTDGNQQT